MCVFQQPGCWFSWRRTKPHHFESHTWNVCFSPEPEACFICRLLLCQCRHAWASSPTSKKCAYFPSGDAINFRLFFKRSSLSALACIVASGDMLLFRARGIILASCHCSHRRRKVSHAWKHLKTQRKWRPLMCTDGCQIASLFFQ